MPVAGPRAVARESAQADFVTLQQRFQPPGPGPASRAARIAARNRSFTMKRTTIAAIVTAVLVPLAVTASCTFRQVRPTMQTVHTSDAPAAIGPYSQAVVANGFVFTAGQVPFDPATMQLVEGDIGAQTEQVMKNVTAILRQAGVDLSSVVKTTVFLRDMNDFNGMNEVYARHFGDHKPARSTVQVARLPRDVAVEIEAIAVLADR
jgi:2-iminobutanoate/2-iminopropanoate deaminase